MNIETLFNEMKDLAQRSEKFFMNHHVYRGHNVVVFDYSLTIPADFSSRAALECRGSVFEVDEDMNFIKCLCRPYEKFLNSHEYDYMGNQPLHDNVNQLYGISVAGADDVRNLEVDYALEKLDGSIISAFDFHGELDMKSNSSLTSEYKVMAYELIKDDEYLFQKSRELTEKGYTVIYEFLSSSPKYQIVLTYRDTRLIVTGVRHNDTGEYLTHNELVQHFGQEHVVKVVDSWSWDDADNKEDMEGYVIITKSGLRIKMKTAWYIRHHNTKENFLSTARHFWEAYINGETDDIFLIIKGNDILENRFFELLKKSDDLYTNIVTEGHDYYLNNRDLNNVDYYTRIKNYDFKYPLSSTYATLLRNYTHEEAARRINEKLLIKKTISELKISDW